MAHRKARILRTIEQGLVKAHGSQKHVCYAQMSMGVWKEVLGGARRRTDSAQKWTRVCEGPWSTKAHILFSNKQTFVREAVDDAHGSLYFAHHWTRLRKGARCTEACMLRTNEQGFVKEAVDDGQRRMYLARNLRRVWEGPCAQNHVFYMQMNNGL